MRPGSFDDDQSPEEVKLKNRRSRATLAVNKLLSYKHLRGFKEVNDIKEIYSWEKELGAG